MDTVNNLHPFKDEIQIKKMSESPLVLKMCKETAYLLGFLTFVQYVEKPHNIVVFKIEDEITQISANLITNLKNLKIVSNMGAENCQILNLQISEAELSAVLLNSQPYLYRILNKKIQIGFVNPQTLTFKIGDIFDNYVSFKYAKLSLDFRKHVIKFNRKHR